MLSALAVQEQAVLGHVLIEDGKGDLRDRGRPAPDRRAGLSDCLYTLDALHLQNTVEGLAAATTIPPAYQPRLLARLREQVRRRPAHDEHYSATLAAQPHRAAPRARGPWPPAAAWSPGIDHFQCPVEVTRTTEIFIARKTFVPAPSSPPCICAPAGPAPKSWPRPSAATGAIENRLHHVLTLPWPRMPAASAATSSVLQGCGISRSTCCDPMVRPTSPGLYRNALPDPVLNYAGVRSRNGPVLCPARLS
ncbi:MAG: hypothetical protein U1F21_09685 [Sphaerotilus natans]